MKKWIVERFLPMWAKETVLKDNRMLRKEIVQLRRKLQEAEAYIQGIQAGMRSMKRIRIYERGGQE